MEDSDQSDPTLLTDMTPEGQDIKDSSARQPISSVGMGSPGSDAPDQLTMVEEMVMEMKSGFVTVLEELAKIQFDERKQKEWLERASQYETQIAQLTDTVESLKVELSKMSEQMKTYGEHKDILLQELQRNGHLSNHCRERLNLKAEVTTLQSDFDSGVNLPQQCGSSGGATTPPGLSPMVKPFMESLPTTNGVKHGEDHYDSDSVSITALANRSLQLSETLRAKYQDASSRESSNGDEQENSSFEDTLLSVNKMNGGQQYPGLTSKNQLHDQAFSEKQRQRLTSEILSSERKYCSTLWTLIDDYISPLRQMNLMSSHELNCIFPPYLTQMYAQHCSILRKLEDRVLNWRWNGIVGDIFAKLTDTQENDLLTLYRDYVSDFPTALSNLNTWKMKSKKFSSFLKNHHHGPGSEGTDVTTLILAPVQRLAHYVLLIKDLLRFTDDNHSDRYYLVASLAILRNFLNQLNEEIQHVVQLVEENRRSSQSTAASVKSSASSNEVINVLSARDSGIHSTGEEIVKLHQSPPPRQLVSRRNQKPENLKYSRQGMDSYSRRLRLATSQPNINRLITPHQRQEAPHRERSRRSQGRKTVDSFPMMQSLLPQRSASPSVRHSAVPRLQLEDYYEPMVVAESRSYREEPMYQRPRSVVGQSYMYEDYEMDRLAQLAQNRPHSATEEVLLRDSMFHTDAELQLQRMLDLQENNYPPSAKRNVKARDRLSLTPDEEHYGSHGVRNGRPRDLGKLTGIDHLIESGLLMRSQSPQGGFSTHREDAYTHDYGIFGDNDDVEEDDDGDYRPATLSSTMDPVLSSVDDGRSISKSKSQGNVPVSLTNGYQLEEHANDNSPRDHALPSASNTNMHSDYSVSDDQLQTLAEQNMQSQQHITTKTLLEMTRGKLTPVKPPDQSQAEAGMADPHQEEQLAVTSIPPMPSTLPRPDSRQGKVTPLKLPKKKTQDKAKIGFSNTLSRSVDDVSKNKKKNSIRDSLKNIFNKKKSDNKACENDVSNGLVCKPLMEEVNTLCKCHATSAGKETSS
ncbi:uncharacterized protein LOC135467989 [Liolophura sinensis]|uniref:uncharacterized protein LOC135467989 n=1 Tax=Liolophura sinensis TaxID=3198878 RepID=UPI003158968D